MRRSRSAVSSIPMDSRTSVSVMPSFARTSGGRYIVPTDWIISLYYMLGIFYVIAWLASLAGTQSNIFVKTADDDESKHGAKNRSSKILLVFVILLGFGGFIPL